MTSEPAFAIDDTSALGRRALALLSGAGLARPRASERDARRTLLVDASAAEQERAARASRLVLVSQALPLAGDRSGAHGRLAFAPGHRAVLVRNQPYLESLLPRLALGLSSGRFLSAAPTQETAYVAHEDAAIVAAALLVSDLQPPETLHVTGPAAFSHRALCALAAKLFSRQVQVEEIALERLSAELVARGMSAEQAELGARCDGLLLTAHEGAPSGDGPRVTGVAALSLHAFLDRMRDSLEAALRERRLPAEPPARPGMAGCAAFHAS
jgi:hypothetical protein